MLALALVQALASAACVPLLFLVTRRLFSRDAGLLAALLGALYGPSVHFSVTMLRDTWIALAALGVVLALQRWAERQSRRAALAAGVVAGLALLVNEAFSSMLALAAVWLWWRCEGTLVERWRQAGAFLAGAALAFSPVAARNLAVGAPAASLAVMGSTAAAVFDTSASNPWFFEIHPEMVKRVLAEGDGRMGPTLLACWRTFDGWAHVAGFYLKKTLGLLVPYENPDNVNYYYAALRSPLLAALPGYGLALPLALLGLVVGWRRRRELAVLLPVALSLLMGMLFMIVLSRYRATFALLALLPLAGGGLEFLLARARERRFTPLLAGTGAVLAVALAARTVQSSVVFAGRSAEAAMYRPSEFILGARFFEQRGRLGAAAGELRDLARLNPTAGLRVSAFVGAAQFEARRRSDLDEARAAAVARPELLLQVADAYVALLGERRAAVTLLREAAALPAAPELRAVVEARLRSLESGTP